MTTGDRSVPTHTHSTTHGQMPGSRYSRRLHRESWALRGMVAESKAPGRACGRGGMGRHGRRTRRRLRLENAVTRIAGERASTPRCFGPRNHTPSMQSPAVSRSRHLTVCDGVSVCVPVRLCQTSGASDIATLPWRLLLRHRSHRLSRVQALQNVARDPLLPFAMQ